MQRRDGPRWLRELEDDGGDDFDCALIALLMHISFLLCYRCKGSSNQWRIQKIVLGGSKGGLDLGGQNVLTSF